MNKKNKLSLILLMTLSSLAISEIALASEADALDQTGKVTVEGSGTTKPVDPENPGTDVDPGEGPSTEGTLRIDYASSLDFGRAQITEKNRTYNARAQLFKDDTPARGSYIQITDERDDAYGWTLQVKQTTQFTNSVIQDKENQQLTGAVLSLDKGWANSFGASIAPTVTRDTIAINEIGQAYQVARADAGGGTGTWTIEFGSSGTEKAQANTLTPETDAAGKALIDETYQKQAYRNSAISLSIPDSTKIYPVQYQTELTWILSEIPQ